MAKLHKHPLPSFRDVLTEDFELGGLRARALRFTGGARDPGRAVVCIHGMGANGRSFMRQRPLSRDRLFLLLNLPEATPDGLDPVQFQADAVEEFLEAKKLDRPVLVGSSFGGAVAATVALRRPARLAGLVLVSAVLSRRQIPLATPRFVDVLGAPEPIARIFAPLAAQIMGGLSLDREARDEIVREGRNVSGRELKRRLLALMQLELFPRLAGLDLPALAVHGRRDWMVPWRRGRWVAEAIPGCGFKLIPGAGHLPYLSHPAPFNQAVGAFLEGLSSGAAAFARPGAVRPAPPA